MNTHQDILSRLWRQAEANGPGVYRSRFGFGWITVRWNPAGDPAIDEQYERACKA